jgi:hypothetical protein
MRFDRNNQTYRMLMNVCWLVAKGLLQTRADGTSRLMDFLDEQRMSRLYEKFILGYYKREHPELDGVAARFASPTLHTPGELSNFVTQVSSVRDGFGKTDYAARLLGVPDEELESVKSDEVKAASAAAFSAMFGGAQ